MELKTSPDSIATLELVLKIDYPSINTALRKRYATMLAARAIRIYVEEYLDSAAVAEDLYHGEDFDCTCTQADADRNRHAPSCEYKGNKNYVNLLSSEENELDYFKGLQKLRKHI